MTKRNSDIKGQNIGLVVANVRQRCRECRKKLCGRCFEMGYCHNCGSMSFDA